jgi:hypothetical protein
MSKLPVTFMGQTGGMVGGVRSYNSKSGPPDSFAYGRGLDFWSDPSSVTMANTARKDSSTVVTGLIVDMIRLPSGKFVAVDNAGGVYTRTTALAGTWTKLGTTLTNNAIAVGMKYNLQQDMVYIPGDKNIHTITNADGRFGGSITVNNNALSGTVDQSAIVSTTTYTSPGSVSEADVDRLYVTPTIEPMKSIKLWVTAKGTGTLAIVMHDAAGNQLALETLASAAATNGQLNEIVFTTPVRNTVKPNASTYHFHIFNVSGTAWTIGSATLNDFRTARFETWADMLIGQAYGNGMHPMIEFLNYMLIGNERYVTAWEVLSPNTPTNTELLRHRVVLEPGYCVTSFALWGEYVCIAAEKRSTSDTNIIDAGRLYFWDGVSAGWNFAVDLPEGSPYSVFTYLNTIYYLAAGALWATVGGPPVKIARLPYTTENGSGVFYMVNYPNMMAVRDTMLHFGFASDTNNRQIEHGIYTWGSTDKNYDPGLGFTYRSSQGGLTQNANGAIQMHVGMVRAFGPLMFMSYYDNGSYFVDEIDPTSAPSSSVPSRWESLVYDAGRPDKEKEAIHLRVDMSSATGGGQFPFNCLMTLYWRIDRSLTWQTDSRSYITSDKRYFQMAINKRFHEIQVAWEIQGVSGPRVVATTLMVETLGTEQD